VENVQVARLEDIVAKEQSSASTVELVLTPRAVVRPLVFIVQRVGQALEMFQVVVLNAVLASIHLERRSLLVQYAKKDNIQVIVSISNVLLVQMDLYSLSQKRDSVKLVRLENVIFRFSCAKRVAKVRINQQKPLAIAYCVQMVGTN
jgi:hypothetical protein